MGGFEDYEIDRSLSENKWADFWASKTCGRVCMAVMIAASSTLRMEVRKHCINVILRG